MYHPLRRRLARTSRGVRHVFFSLSLIGIVLVVGVVGYILIEKMTFTQALYMTIITISTVGFREVRVLSTAGQYFTIFLIMVGVSSVLFFIAGVFEFILSEYLGDVWGRKRMKNEIAKMENHYIICGFGRVGRSVAEELFAQRKQFAVIEKDEERFQECVQDGFLALLGSATDGATLENAGLMRAVGLVSALRSDADNLYVILSARVKRPHILLIARADQPESEDKLELVGADRVISPHKIAGKRMANLLSRPGACEFLDVVSAGNLPEYQLNELAITATSPLAGKSIQQTRLRERTGVTVLSMRKAGESQFNPNPASDSLIEDGDVLLVIGTPEQMGAMESLK